MPEEEMLIPKLERTLATWKEIELKNSGASNVLVRMEKKKEHKSSFSLSIAVAVPTRRSGEKRRLLKGLLRKMLE
ncbi:hypothetical protein [Saccharibacillus deserti]|uniref:hypothetical protein n=1 Tax=Saccharibacillus deserti TaxID=1634444 RepID=UPI0015542607|nr:hypothetical protein [Saccharibacillus deserti]